MTLILSSREAYTIEEAIRAAARVFEQNSLSYGHGTDTAIDEASWLVLHAVGLSPVQAPDYSLSLSNEQILACNQLLSLRVVTRKPAAYLTGEAWFAGHRFLCDERALVPRSPLAEFINGNYWGLLDHHRSPVILDLCTGGGCIAIACALALPEAKVDASDVSPEALSLAKENVYLHGLQERVSLFEGSLFDPIEASYDLIISNPPYVDAQDIAAMPREFLHEPLLGLEAGDDGLDLVRVMLRQAASYLKPGGALVVEVGNSWEALERTFADIEFNWLTFDQGGYGVFMVTREQLGDCPGIS